MCTNSRNHTWRSWIGFLLRGDQGTSAFGKSLFPAPGTADAFLPKVFPSWRWKQLQPQVPVRPLSGRLGLLHSQDAPSPSSFMVPHTFHPFSFFCPHLSGHAPRFQGSFSSAQTSASHVFQLVRWAPLPLLFPSLPILLASALTVRPPASQAPVKLSFLAPWCFGSTV